MNETDGRWDAIIVDLDGTLADVSAARHLVKRGQKSRNFDAFHQYATTEAPVNDAVRDIIYAMSDCCYSAETLLVSGRMEKWRQPTEEWLKKHGIRYFELWMRQDSDYREDRVVKEEIYRTYIQDHYNVLFAIDDSPTVVALWRELGIPVFVVPGYED